MVGRINESVASPSQDAQGSHSLARHRSDFAGERSGGMLRFDMAPTPPQLVTELGALSAAIATAAARRVHMDVPPMRVRSLQAP